MNDIKGKSKSVRAHVQAQSEVRGSTEVKSLI